jgi:outer membrane protein assembly factor BamD
MRFICLLLLSVTLITGCADKVIPAGKKAQFHAEQGEKFLQNEDYEDAIAAWEKVRDSFHSPELTVLAELKISEAYYLNEKYPEATAACELFLKNHPNHPEMPTVFFRLGMSYFMQMLPAEKDQTASKNAVITFRNLLKRYPGINNADEIRRHIETARDRMAEHEVEVARFYLRTDELVAAQKRFDYMRKTYPDYLPPEYIYFDIGEAYLELGDRDTAIKVFNQLKEKYPSSKYLEEVEELLQENLNSKR